MSELVDSDRALDSTQMHDVEVEIGFTKSMGKGSFEFLRVDVRHRAHLEPGETRSEATKRLYRELEDEVVAAVDELDLALGPRGRDSKIHNNKG